MDRKQIVVDKITHNLLFAYCEYAGTSYSEAVRTLVQIGFVALTQEQRSGLPKYYDVLGLQQPHAPADSPLG